MAVFPCSGCAVVGALIGAATCDNDPGCVADLVVAGATVDVAVVETAVAVESARAQREAQRYDPMVCVAPDGSVRNPVSDPSRSPCQVCWEHGYECGRYD